MNDPIELLEAELSAMRPRDLSAGLTDELVAICTQRNATNVPTNTRSGMGILPMSTRAGSPSHNWSDRALMFAMSMGALAACVVISLLMLQASHIPPAASQVVIAQADELPVRAYAIARASSAWGDDIN